MRSQQEKKLELEFFDRHALGGSEYNVFSEATNQRLVEAFVRDCELSAGHRVLDLGCGSGVFSGRLADLGLEVTGVDLSPGLIEVAKRTCPRVRFEVGDAESLDFADGSFDAAFLGGVVHHFPDPGLMLSEVARVLRRGGRIFSFDPNRRNPFMYLYRDPSSPLYSSRGVTPNERPILVEDLVRELREAGMDVKTDYSSVEYTYVASGRVRLLLPLFNVIDRMLFFPKALKRFRPFVISWGVRQ